MAKASVVFAWLCLGCSTRVILSETDRSVNHELPQPNSAAVCGVFSCTEPRDADPGMSADGGMAHPELTGPDESDTKFGACPVGGGQPGGAEFECGDPCAAEPVPCPCYIETACADEQGDCSGVAVWSLTLDQAAFDYMNEYRNEDIRVPGTLCADSRLYEFTIEVQGASSRRLPKKNYNLRFDERNEIPGEYLGADGTIDKLVIKAMATDRAFVRETLGFDLWRAMGHDAPYSGGADGFVQLLINGRFHGVYSRVEPVDRDYLRRRNMRDDGRLYKGVRSNGSFADFRPERDIEDAFEDETDPDDPDYEVLQQLVDLIQDEKLSSEEFVAELASYFSIDLLIDRMVWVSFTQNGDAVAQNFFLYHQPEEQPPWHLIPWDSNLSFGADWTDPENILDADRAFMLGGNLLAERLLEHPAVVDTFKQRYGELLASHFSADALDARLWPLFDYLRIAMERDRAVWGYPTDASTAFGQLAVFLNDRGLKVTDKLSNWP